MAKPELVCSLLVCLACGGSAPKELFRATPEMSICGEDPGRLFTPAGLQVDDSGRFLILDNTMNQVLVFDSEGGFVSTFGEAGEGPGQLAAPFFNFCIDVSGNSYLVDCRNTIEVFDSDGQFLRSISLPQLTIFDLAATDSLIVLNCPSPLPGDSGGVMAVIGQDGSIVRRFGDVPRDLDGLPPWLCVFHQTCPVDVDEDGNIYYTSILDYALYKYRPDGTMVYRTDPPSYPEPVVRENVIVTPSVWDLCVDGGMVFVLRGESEGQDGTRVDVFSCETGDLMGFLYTGIPLECRPPFICVRNGSELYTADPEIATVYGLSLSRI